MAIAIEGFSIVGRKARLEENFDGGLEALSKIVPNATELADDDLWRCSFMAAADAETFLEQLQEAGLNSNQGPDSDLVLVSEFDLSIEPYCEWLKVVQWEKGVIAWLEGTTPETVVAREGWSPEKGSGLEFANSVDDENLEFRRLEGDLQVYFDRKRGCEVFVGRTGPDPDALYKAASKIILDHNVEHGHSRLNGEAETKVRQAISDLESVARQFPDSWQVFWFLGKGRQAVGELELAYESFGRAFSLEQETEAVPREFASVCLELGKADEAVQIGQTAAALKPDNPETLGNLACAYLIAARIPEAVTTIKAALKLHSEDRINVQLQRIINEVAKGERPQPRRMSDLNQPIVPTTKADSFWSRLRFWKR